MMYVAFLDSSHTQANEEGAEHGDHTAIFDDERLQKAVNTLLKTKIFTHFTPEQMNNQSQSLQDVPQMDLLVIPQASLAGKINKKGNSVQFHSLIKNKETGESLYYRFVHFLRVARNVDENEILTLEAVSSFGVLTYTWHSVLRHIRVDLLLGHGLDVFIAARGRVGHITAIVAALPSLRAI